MKKLFTVKKNTNYPIHEMWYEKRLVFKTLMCLIYLIIITLLSVCIYQLYQEKLEIIPWSEAKSVNDYSYINVSYMSEKFAVYEDEGKEIHFVIEEEDTGQWHTYLIAINTSDYDKFKSIIDYTYERTKEVPNPIKVYGYPVLINDELKDLAIGIYCQGNTIYGKNVEIIGTYHYGLYLNGCSVGSWQDTNISGSTSQYLMKNGIKIENSNDVDFNTCWFEQLADGSGVLTKSIEVIDSKQISLNNMHLASGSMFVNNSENIKIYNSRYYTTSAGLRYLNNSKITCDKISLGYCNYQANEEYCMGDINIIDFSNQSNENLLNNPILLQGIYEFLSITNSASTKSTNTTDMLTGDRCFNFNTSNYQGARVNTSNILENGKKYTILAYVKAVSDNIDKIYLKTSGISADTTHPNQFYKNIDNNKNYHLIRLTGTVNNETNNVDIIARSKDSNKCDFIIDSVFIVEGQHDNTIPFALNKEGILRNSKLTASTAPYAGIWNKGDIVYNNFVNSSNDNIMF